MRSAKHFTADLLLGGVRLRRLECELHEVPDIDEEIWTGRFQIPRGQLELFEANRPYLMELEDGRQGRVIVDSVEPLCTDDGDTVFDSVRVHLGFRPAKQGDV